MKSVVQFFFGCLPAASLWQAGGSAALGSNCRTNERESPSTGKKRPNEGLNLVRAILHVILGVTSSLHLQKVLQFSIEPDSL